MLIWKLMGSPPLMWGGGVFFIFFYKGIALPNNLLQSILKSEKNWKSFFFFFLNYKNHEIHRNYLSCQIVILRGIFHFFDPKLDFSYISRHVLSDYVKKKFDSLKVYSRYEIKVPLKGIIVYFPKNARFSKSDFTFLWYLPLKPKTQQQTAMPLGRFGRHDKNFFRTRRKNGKNIRPHEKKTEANTIFLHQKSFIM